MLQSLFRPVLRPIMMGVMSVTGSRRAWTPAALWPTGTEPGMWIDPSNLDSSWADYTGTTPVATPGTVADSSNPVGLALDLRLGATALTDPGNHLLQATSTARPLESARVNTLWDTENFDAPVWTSDIFGASTFVKTTGQIDPLGGATAARLVVTNPGTGDSVAFRFAEGLATESVYRTWYIKSNTGVAYNVYVDDTLVTLAADADWHEYRVLETVFSWGTRLQFYQAGICDVTVAFPDRRLSTQPPSIPTYQQVGSYASGAYTATGFPIFQKYDGTDDGMATASFAAGTLSNAMDCMIAVRRDSAGNAVCGLYESVAEANKVFGIAESGSGSGCVGSGAGTPTVWVDGVQLTGGTAVTRGTLHTALTVGDYHVLEFRGLDLSTWTASGFGLYTSYVLNGAQGGILLFPSSTSAADRDAARTWLGAKVGLTL